MTLELVHNKAEASGKHFCFSKPLLLHRYGSRQCLQVTPSSLKYSISKITSLLHRNKSETALNVKTLCVSSPQFSHNSDLKQPQDKLMFQKPLNNSLARASNKHCSLHRIHQVDMKDKLAGWYQMFPIPCSHRAVKAVWSVGITLSFSWCDCELTDRPLWPRWERPWSSDQPHRGKWRIFPSGVEANRRKRKRECPTRTPPLSFSYHDPNVGQEQRETLTWTTPQEQGPLSGSLWVIQFSSLNSKIKFTWKSLDCTDDQLNYSPELSLLLMKSAFIIKQLSVLWTMRRCLFMSHLLHKSIQICLHNYRGLFDFLHLCDCSGWKWADGNTDCAMTCLIPE